MFKIVDSELDNLDLVENELEIAKCERTQEKHSMRPNGRLVLSTRLYSLDSSRWLRVGVRCAVALTERKHKSAKNLIIGAGQI